MLVFVAVHTQEFPVAAVGRVVVVIVVPVMHRQFAQPFSLKFTGAAAANRRKHLQRLLSIPIHAIVAFTSEFRNKFPITFRIICRHGVLLYYSKLAGIYTRSIREDAFV